MKKAALLISSGCWLLFAVGLGLILLRYLTEGAGLQSSAWLFSDSSILIGVVHICGLAFASLACVAVSAGLWVRAFAPLDQPRKSVELTRDD
jgi:hypothetical protein